MKARFILLILGLAFVVTLAVIIGQRLSAEAMAVMVGVVAGVAASIPTSLLVVWFANRALLTSRATVEMSAPMPAPAPRSAPVEPQPQIVVMAPPASANLPATYQNVMPYPMNNAASAYSAMPLAPTARQFTVIGGADVALEDSEANIWP
jgi:hypothetical protein